jgi:hypothetical protein
VSGERAEVPTLVESPGFVINAVEHYCGGRKGLTGVMAISQRLGEQAAPKASALIRVANA